MLPNYFPEFGKGTWKDVVKNALEGGGILGFNIGKYFNLKINSEYSKDQIRRGCIRETLCSACVSTFSIVALTAAAGSVSPLIAATVALAYPGYNFLAVVKGYFRGRAAAKFEEGVKVFSGKAALGSALYKH